MLVRCRDFFDFLQVAVSKDRIELPIVFLEVSLSEKVNHLMGRPLDFQKPQVELVEQ